jgi:hypothetical protein
VPETQTIHQSWSAAVAIAYRAIQNGYNAGFVTDGIGADMLEETSTSTL